MKARELPQEARMMSRDTDAMTKKKEDDEDDDVGIDAEHGGHQRGARYITPEGFRRLQEELEKLWKEDRPRVTSEVAAAAALGDRSENAEYIYGKKKLREIDRRIRYLSKRLDSLTVVKSPPGNDRVYFGAWVTVEDEEGVSSTYRIVGPDEFDVRQRKISVESPLGKALLGKKEGDEVTVIRPKGSTEVTVLKIKYQSEHSEP